MHRVTPSISNVEHYAKIFAGTNKARKLQKNGAHLTFDNVAVETVDENTNEVMSELFELTTKSKSKKLKNISDVGIEVFDGYINSSDDAENKSDTG